MGTCRGPALGVARRVWPQKGGRATDGRPGLYALPMTTTLSPGSTREAILAPGEVAPDFEVQNQDRKPWKLSEALAKGDVVLCFFPFAFTSVCGTEMKCITDETARWREKGMQVIGVSCDSWAALKAWADKEGFTHTMLSDLHRTVCRAYGLYWADLNVAWRGTVVIGRHGKVLWSQKREIKAAMTLDEVLAAVS